MKIYRKIGGIHWLAIGRLRVSFCMRRRCPVTFAMPIDLNQFPRGHLWAQACWVPV